MTALAEQFFVSSYEELRVLAERQLRRGGRDLSLGATTLLHEAWIALDRSSARFPDKARFMGYVARAMRGLIVDHVRHERAEKRGGGAFEITLRPDLVSGHTVQDAQEVERLNDALNELAMIQHSLAELVDLHFVAGLTFSEIAAMRGVSERTVQRDWRKARLILHRMLLNDQHTAAA